MATLVPYVWRPFDDLYLVALAYQPQSGYPDVSSLVEAIKSANPRILDWTAIPLDPTVPVTITIPFNTQ